MREALSLPKVAMSVPQRNSSNWFVRRVFLISPIRYWNSTFVLAVGSRLWSAGAGLITLNFITGYLLPVEQGYYYTFNGLAQITQLVDLGLQVLIIQFASHEAAGLTFGPKGRIFGDPVAISRLLSLGRFGILYYSVGALFLLPLLIGTGYWMFGAGAHIRWEGPWFALSGLVVIDLILSNFIWLLEGTNQIAFVYTYRLTRGVITSVSIWICLHHGLGLWAIPFGLLAAIAATLVFLLVGRPVLMLLLLKWPRGPTISWRHEILPLQWRLAVSAVAGYATYSLFVPITFKFAGAVMAGKFGLTWSLMENMTAVALMALNLNFPSMGSLAARRDWVALDRVAFRASILSLFLTILGVASLLGLAFYLETYVQQYGGRLLGMLPFTILGLAAVLKTIQVALILYLRAHRQEPIVAVTSVAAPLTVLGSVAGAWVGGATGVAVSYLLIMLIVWLPYTAWLTIRLRAAWHSTPTVAAPSA
jgi:hypothetical protein